MTLGQAIELHKEAYPGTFSDARITFHLSTLDRLVETELHSAYEGAPGSGFKDYSMTTPLDTELLIKAPYDRVYTEYLGMMCNLYFSDIERYNNLAALFYNSYTEFVNHYNRTHRHKSAVDSFTTM